jgi:hypothetical protein
MLLTRKEAMQAVRGVIEVIGWNECEIDDKTFQFDPLNYITRVRLLTEVPNAYWLCDVSFIISGEKAPEINVDLKLKQNRKCIDKAYYTIYVNGEGGIDKVVQK